LADTTRWLARPQGWDHGGSAARASDKGLARIQFATALAEAIDAGLAKDRQLLKQAANLVLENQQKDGSWQVDVDGSIGSPATYGAILATGQAIRVLKKADTVQFASAIAKADRWLRKISVRNVLDAAALLLAMEENKGLDVPGRRQRCLELILKGQANDGGWGPYAASAAEPFDTAVVLLGLSRQADRAEIKRRLQQGRTYLSATQQPDGSWQETTRPPGLESYAQRISTTAWATLALLETRQLK
jgi:squalene cyclase